MEYVDLGLSVKWAVENLGASSPEDYGDLFAWGEVSPRNNFTPSNYVFSKESEMPASLTCGNDAAATILGQGWRMPTKTEFEELSTKCTWELLKGSKGKYCWKVIGGNGNFILLPACRKGEEWRTGDYWSSTRSLLDNQPSFPCGLAFGPHAHGVMFYDGYQGLSVRPVYSK